MHEVNQFMWGFQVHFRALAEGAAERLFALCNPALSPTVFLVGVLMDADSGTYPICIEPEKNELMGNSMLEPKHFRGIVKAAKKLRSSGANVFVVHPSTYAAKRYEQVEAGRALSQVVQRRMDSVSKGLDAVHFCSMAVRVGPYAVIVVLRLRRSEVKSLYSLRMRDRKGMTLDTSFLNALIRVFLEDQAAKLDMNSPGSNWGEPRRSAEELCRVAGERLTLSAGYAGGSVEGAHQLFEVCNAVAAMQYEGAEGHGGLVLCSRDHPDVQFEVEFTTPIELSEHRAVRKVVEATGIERKLISDGVKIFGLARLRGKYDGLEEDLFEIRFVRRYCWELYHSKNLMMRVTSGLPEVPRASNVRATVEDRCIRAFPKLSSKKVRRLSGVVSDAVALRRGCTLVISQFASKEAKRLGGQAVEVIPVKVDSAVLEIGSSVDGALMLDTGANCHGFGVILDGLAMNKGDRSRGSRFNSAVRYQQNCGHGCVVVVVSDDGMVDVIPKLMPRVKKGPIEQDVQALEKLVRKRDIGDRFADVKYNELMDRLEKHAFYLSGIQCKRINAARRKYGSQGAIGAIRVSFSELRVNPEMNKSYFID